MLRTFSNFSYPVFIGVCGSIGIVSDVIEKPQVSLRCSIALLSVGIAILILSPSFVIDRVWRGWFNREMKNEYGSKAFGLSCIVLAGLLYGFSALSQGAQGKGGLIASQFPEIKGLQLSLGVATQQISEVRDVALAIKSETGKLLEASDRWLEFRLNADGDTGPDKNGVWKTAYHHATPLIMNPTNLQFEKVTLVIKSPEEGVVYSKSYPLLTDRQDRWDEQGLKSAYKNLEVCLSAKRRGDTEWLIDRQWLELVPSGKADYMIYQKVDSSGVRVFSRAMDCKAERT